MQPCTERGIEGYRTKLARFRYKIISESKNDMIY